ncbi:FkbM family methyltransferase [Plantactinospora sp. S1510]|uniref:FkbM family methyltransferase n=1 Tax=Plantactinospora alkalitolerans TaxID=2789879 RepID=A0ABS0GX27_9ACTN|nr:FkbM family methyltransferase [Plantactinospora alkalitolerans]MBF9130759.1 FkbM family methyltransferase [Plantactinospora alkalitolerans]
MPTFRSTLRRAFHQSGAQHVRRAAHRIALRTRAGAFRNEIGVILHADHTDIRGTELAVYKGNLDRNAVAAWRRLVAEVRPTVAIDVGANYGEVAFSTSYHGLRELHLVEPNPAVLPWLRKTIAAANGNYPGTVLHAGAASDHSATARLYLHEHTGVASLRVPNDRGVEVECFRLDERIRLRDDDSLLFKIDVEGHEQAALEGMAGLFHNRSVTGICEVLHADEDLLGYLCDRFAVALQYAGTERPVDEPQLRDTLARARESGWGDLGKDVVLRSR